MTFIKAGSGHTMHERKGSRKMSEDNPNMPPCGKYALNINKEDLVNICIKKWVLEWCEKHHPEVFIEAEERVKKMLDTEKDQHQISQ